MDLLAALGLTKPDQISTNLKLEGKSDASLARPSSFARQLSDASAKTQAGQHASPARLERGAAGDDQVGGDALPPETFMSDDEAVLINTPLGQAVPALDIHANFELTIGSRNTPAENGPRARPDQWLADGQVADKAADRFTPGHRQQQTYATADMPQSPIPALQGKRETTAVPLELSREMIATTWDRFGVSKQSTHSAHSAPGSQGLAPQAFAHKPRAVRQTIGEQRPVNNQNGIQGQSRISGGGEQAPAPAAINFRASLPVSEKIAAEVAANGSGEISAKSDHGVTLPGSPRAGDGKYIAPQNLPPFPGLLEAGQEAGKTAESSSPLVTSAELLKPNPRVAREQQFTDVQKLNRGLNQFTAGWYSVDGQYRTVEQTNAHVAARGVEVVPPLNVAAGDNRTMVNGHSLRINFDKGSPLRTTTKVETPTTTVISLAETLRADRLEVSQAPPPTQLSVVRVENLQEQILKVLVERRVSEGKLEIKLAPARLGTLQISMQQSEQGELQIAMLAREAATRDMLEQHLPRLRSALQEAGIQLGDVDIRQESQHEQKRNTNPEHESSDGVVASSDEPADHQVARQEAQPQDGRIRVYV